MGKNNKKNRRAREQQTFYELQAIRDGHAPPKPASAYADELELPTESPLDPDQYDKDGALFVKVHEEIDGMVHVSDLDWDEKQCQKILEGFKKGDKVKVKILEINVEKERISLGIKQLSDDPIQNFIESHPLKSKVTGKIVEIDEKFLKVELNDQIFGLFVSAILLDVPLVHHHKTIKILYY